MKRINKILKHQIYITKFNALQEAEADRIFCNHTMEHFLDVARLMYIKSLENGYDLSKEIIYGAALMHDIGRIDQIKDGVPHEVAGANACNEILPECDFKAAEINMIAAAILRHRNASSVSCCDEHRNASSVSFKDGHKNDEASNGTQDQEALENILCDLLYWADKRSRNCFSCNAAAECNWLEDKRNKELEY